MMQIFSVHTTGANMFFEQLAEYLGAELFQFAIVYVEGILNDFFSKGAGTPFLLVLVTRLDIIYKQLLSLSYFKWSLSCPFNKTLVLLQIKSSVSIMPYSHLVENLDVVTTRES